MKEMTVCFMVKDTSVREVLLGFKKAGFGAGKYAGIGGRQEPGETIAMAAIREVEEEVGIRIFEQDLQNMGKITFLFPWKPEWNQTVTIFRVENWQGELRESSEMKPSWFRYEEIPFGSMWQDACYWLPRILDGTQVQAQITFKEDNETVDEVRFTSI
jgi:8-oxo-dGTP diphosphatase